MALFVRRLRISDFPRLEEIESAHERAHSARGGWLERVRKLLTLALSDEPEGLLIADLDGKVVGWAAVRQRQLHPLAGDGLGHILHVSVAAEHRKQGIGQRLLRECEAYLRTHGCSGVRISVGVADSSAEKLMKKAGYSPTAWEMERRFR
ncbi:MAG: GNAT family N-acetyltransferase [Myxococcaceae bacterium]